MTFEELERALDLDVPPEQISELLRALWFAKKGDWNAAHVIVSDIDSAMASRIHAHLHRVEGDLSNARYWYRQAGVEPEAGPLESEWVKLARAATHHAR